MNVKLPLVGELCHIGSPIRTAYILVLLLFKDRSLVKPVGVCIIKNSYFKFVVTNMCLITFCFSCSIGGSELIVSRTLLYRRTTSLLADDACASNMPSSNFNRHHVSSLANKNAAGSQ